MIISKKNLIYLVLVVVVLVFVSTFSMRSKSNADDLIQYSTKEDYTDLNLSQLSDERDFSTTSKETIKNTTNAIKTQKSAVVSEASLKIGCNLSILSEVSQDKSGGMFYFIKLFNQGNISCTNATISLYYDDSVTFVSSVPKPTASNYYWHVGDIGPDVIKLITITLKSDKGGVTVIDTQACATADNAVDACMNITNNTSGGQISSVNSSPVSVLKTALPTSVLNNKDQEYGSWVWVSPINMSQEYMRKVVDGASMNGINVLYVTIDDYLDIEAISDFSVKKERKKNYTDAIERFVRIAKDKNISVDLEAGWRDWGDKDKRFKATVILDYVIEYNNEHANKIRGIQYDIEPYLLSNYEEDKVSLLTDFVSLVDDVSQRLGKNQLILSVVIPHFYDSEKDWTPAITHKGITTHTYNHILRILDQRSGSKIIIMAYRNKSEGNNGTVDLVHKEIEDASTGFHNTKVIVGQESGDVEPSYVTFFSLSKEEYNKQKKLIEEELSGRPGFGGVAIHYIDSFLDME